MLHAFCLGHLIMKLSVKGKGALRKQYGESIFLYGNCKFESSVAIKGIILIIRVMLCEHILCWISCWLTYPHVSQHDIQHKICSHNITLIIISLSACLIFSLYSSNQIIVWKVQIKFNFIIKCSIKSLLIYLYVDSNFKILF